MGTDKADLPVGNSRMIDRVVNALVLSAVCDEIVVVGGPDRSIDGSRHVEDAYPGEGPLGGLVTAFHSTTAARLIVLACDLPWVVETNVQRLDQFDAVCVSADVVAPVVGGRPQWLAAVWYRTAYGRVRAAFDDGVRSIRQVASELCVVGAPPEISEGFGDVDTPAEYQRDVLNRSD